MSFTRDVKLEILENRPMRRHYQDALAYGLFLHSQYFTVKEISLRTRFKQVAEEFQRLCYGIIGEDARVKVSEIGVGDSVYKVWIVDKKKRVELLEYFEKQNILKEQDDEKVLYAFLAGVFLASGSVTNPKKGYHLELVLSTKEMADNIIKLYEKRLPNLKVTHRRKQYLVYCKECSQIQDALTMMGASKASLHMIEVEMYKNVRNHANRVTNFETANIDKQVDAATSQIEDLKLILRVKGEHGITEQQLETAKIRMDNPYASLRELAELFPEPISRSGLHHRLAVLTKMAEQIRKEQVNENV